MLFASIPMFSRTSNLRLRPILTVTVCLVALVSAIPFVGGWFDGGRLATVECLVDYHTWQIDRSIFTGSDGRVTTPLDSPYTYEWIPNVLHGTQDKAFINGHFYSDKSPVVSLLMAASYQVLQWLTGLKTAEHPHIFCYAMALMWCGATYVVAVLAMERLAARINLPPLIATLFSISFAFGTVALTYSRQVNNAIFLLADFAMLFVFLAPSAEAGWVKFSPLQLCVIGNLIGLGYAIDLGAGPVLVLCVAGYIAWRTRSVRDVIIVLAASFPWFALHHALNYMLCGTFKPMGSTPAFFLYPGSQWAPEKLTGVGIAHDSIRDYLWYNFRLLFSQRGFFTYNYTLLLAFPGIVMLWRKRVNEWGLLACSSALICGTILLYGATSNNFAGQSCTIRWFVPLLVPFYYLLAILLRRYPAAAPDFAILTVFSVVLQYLLWCNGPWAPPLDWQIKVLFILAMATWAAYRAREHFIATARQSVN